MKNFINKFNWEFYFPNALKLLMVMKLTVVLILASVLSILAGESYSQTKMLTLKMVDAKVEDVLAAIEKQSEFYFFIYSEKVIDADKKVSIDIEGQNIETVLNTLFAGTDVAYAVRDRLVVLSTPEIIGYTNQAVLQQPQRSVSGKITDSGGQPLPGVTVVVKGTTQGTVTNADGNYLLSNVPENATLVFSFVGMRTQEVVVADQTKIDVTMEVDAIGIGEVVAIGYGTVKKSDLTGSVASVESDIITSTVINSPAEALKGRVAGVDVTNSHNPGSAPNILIRGKNSITGENEPLWVVNGIPIIGSNVDLNPNDIETIDILKDASATAIYGSRGSNGVIIVTTKKAKEGVKFSYDGYVGVQEVANRLEMLSGPEHAEFRREAYRATNNYTNDEAIFDAVELESIREGRYTDWIGLVLDNTGWIHNHNITANVAGERTNTSASFGYLKNQSVMGSKVNYEKFNFSLISELKVSERFEIGASVLLSNSVKNDYSEAVRSFMILNPLGVPYDEEGNLQLYVTPSETLNTNPLVELENNDFQNKAFRIIGNLNAKVKITNDLSYQAIFGNDLRFARQGVFEGSETRHRGGAAARASYENFNTSSYIFDHILNYSKQINDHSINLTGVFDLQKYRQESIYLQATDADFDGLWYNLGAAATVSDKNTRLTEWALLSYMGRLNYSYRDKYYITFTSRYDGSSRLSEKNKWSLFPSAALAWRLSNEEFIKNDILDNLKLRISWGTTGNSSVNPYETLGTLSRVLYNFGETGVYGYVPSGIPNSDLKWEVTTEVNLGVDWGILKNRIGGSIELYNRLTDDLILARTLPITSGYSDITQNIGSVRNKGLEVLLATHPVSRRDFKMNVSFSFSRNINEIVDLYGDQTDDVGNNWFIGHPIDNYYAIKYIGVWQLDEEEVAAAAGAKPGDPKFFSNGEDGTLDLDRDRVIIPAVPSWIGGMNLDMDYKNFDFSAHLYTRQGERRYSETHADISWQGNRAQLQGDYWTPNNPTNEYPRANSNGYNLLGESDIYIKDVSFVRLANLSLGYNLNKNFLGSVFDKFRIYVSVQNPYTWTKFDGWDPEESTLREAHAPMRTYIFGINASF